MKTEIYRYLEQAVEEETEPLLQQQAYLSKFSVLSDIAKDYLIIQATSIASEQAFSIAGNAITKTQNHLLPEIARVCCVKSWIDNNLIK